MDMHQVDDEGDREDRLSAALAEQAMKYADFCRRRGVPQPVVSLAFLSAAVAILIADVGTEAAAATLRDSADRIDNEDGFPLKATCNA